MPSELIVTTSETVPGCEVEKILGLVWGSSIKAKHVGKDIKMALKHIVGGELTEYSEMLEESRKAAVQRMIEHARALGADAVIAMRFATSAITAGAAELLAYGTAVKLKKP